MIFYCINFMRQTEDDNTEHNFFVYALNEAEAEKRFCVTTGYSKQCIISIREVGE